MREWKKERMDGRDKERGWGGNNQSRSRLEDSIAIGWDMTRPRLGLHWCALASIVKEGKSFPVICVMAVTIPFWEGIDGWMFEVSRKAWRNTSRARPD